METNKGDFMITRVRYIGVLIKVVMVEMLRTAWIWDAF